MVGMVAKIALAKAIYAIDKPYTYKVPQPLQERIQVGMRVLVPFGRGNRGSDGIVLKLEQEQPLESLKDIQALLDTEPVLDGKALQLALWMREQYFCTVYDAVKAMLPAGLYFSLHDTLVLCEGERLDEAKEAAQNHPTAPQLLELLIGLGGRGELEQVRGAFGTRDPGSAIRFLEEQGYLHRESSAQRGVGDKKEKLAVLVMPTEEAMSLVTPKRKTAPLRYAVTELLCQLGAASTKELCYFTGASMNTLKSLEKSGILQLEEQEVFRRVEVEPSQPAGPVVLNTQQQQVFEGLRNLMQEGKAAAALLYGVTGSGKTQVYIKLIQETLKQGKKALLLVPEIALTPQLLRIFTAHFGEQIAILHSSLRSGERYDEWKRLRRGKASVAIGTRSAVFAPLDNIGLLILDEEQETSYKSEQSPRYHAREVAKFRCVQHNALLLLGSATPSVESMYSAQMGKYHLFTLTERYNQGALPQVDIVDMKEELRQGNGSTISRALQHAISQNLSKGEQTILFLNRRGTNRMVSCGECGTVPECPRCSVKLTYHSANHRLMCHYCGYSQPLPPKCPKCGGILQFIGVGTQKVQEDLQQLFPQTGILRMDADTISATHTHEKILGEFQKKQVPILIGTQMVAKGLDFPNVTLVGVILADQGLYVDDFRASERTFSLLTQVVGRAGRGEKLGRAVIQTYTPENDVIVFSARQDYDNFFQTEIRLRKIRRDPPFMEFYLMTFSGLNEQAVLRSGLTFRQQLEQELRRFQEPWTLLGPAPASVAKVNNRYRYRLTLNMQQSRPVRQLLSALLQRALTEKENRGVSIYIDVNPYGS